MKVLNEYPTHHYWDDYERTSLFCPGCGYQEVWENQSAGDYYVGTDFICLECGSEFYLPDGVRKIKDSNATGKLIQLRLGKAATPKTPPANG